MKLRLAVATFLLGASPAFADNGLPDDYDIWGIQGQIVSVTAEGIMNLEFNHSGEEYIVRIRPFAYQVEPEVLEALVVQRPVACIIRYKVEDYISATCNPGVMGQDSEACESQGGITCNSSLVPFPRLATSYGVGIMSCDEVDRRNILTAEVMPDPIRTVQELCDRYDQ